MTPFRRNSPHCQRWRKSDIARSGFVDLAHGGRQGDASCSQGEARGGTRRRAQEKTFTVLFDLGLGQRIEIREDIRPRTRMAERRNAVLQLFFQDKGEKTARHMAANGLVELVKNRARGEQAL